MLIMEKRDIDIVVKKLNIKEEDIVSMSETWSFVGGFSEEKQNLRSKYKVYYVITKDGKSFTLKMDYPTKVIREKSEPGFDLMVE